MKKEEAKVKYQAGEIQICYDVDNIKLLREITGFQNYKGLANFYFKAQHREYRIKDITIINISEITELEEEVVWLGSELQVSHNKGQKWVDCTSELIYRLKPKPDYEEEIIALQTKAIKNGMKAVITFEKL